MTRSLAGLNRASIRQLQLIVAVSDRGSMVAAAEQVGLTQPAVTKAVREIERDLGVTLFDRSNRGVAPTIYGEALVRRAKMIIAQLSHAADEIDDLASGTGGRVVIGTLLAGAAWLLPLAVARLRQDRPKVVVSIVEGTNERLMPLLQNGEVDMVVGRLSELRYLDSITQEALYEENVIVVARKGHPLDDGRVKSTAQLQSADWILPPPDTTLRRQIDQAFVADGLRRPYVAIESVSLQTNRRLLRSTDLLCVLPKAVVADDIAAGHLAHIPTERDRGAGPVGITFRKQMDLSPAATHFAAALRAAAAERASK